MMAPSGSILYTCLCFDGSDRRTAHNSRSHSKEGANIQISRCQLGIPTRIAVPSTSVCDRGRMCSVLSCAFALAAACVAESRPHSSHSGKCFRSALSTEHFGRVVDVFARTNYTKYEENGDISRFCPTQNICIIFNL